VSFHAMDLLESHLLYFARHVGFASNNSILHMGMIHYYILTSFCFSNAGWHSLDSMGTSPRRSSEIYMMESKFL